MRKRRRLSDVDLTSVETECASDDVDYGSSSRSKFASRRTQHEPKRRNLTTTFRSHAKGNAIAHSSSAHTIRSADSIQIALLQWYSSVHTSRGMPWRKTFDPFLDPEQRGQRAYEVWISEIMLQQTQVSTVIPYYTRWMERFPTIRELADATVDDVNTLWKGLGYYSRASRLLSGAKKAVHQYDGRLPDNAAALEKDIPGIGRYSAGAIASIAYGERVPVLDGNVHRLLSRLLALHAPPKSKATLDILWSAAHDLVQKTDSSTISNVLIPVSDSSANCMEKTQYPGDINQALIELGSTVCKPREAACNVCPLQRWCQAFAATTTPAAASDFADIEDLCTVCEPLEDNATVTAYPMKVNRKKPREELDIVNIIEWRPDTTDGNRWFLMVRRPEEGLLAGLYEFPTAEDNPETTSESTQRKILHTLLRQLLDSSCVSEEHKKVPEDALRIASVKPVQDVLHIFSHIRKTYRPQWVLLEGGSSLPLLRGRAGGSGKKKVRVGTESPVYAKWVELEEVAHTNTGTGMNKVWKLTRKLW